MGALIAATRVARSLVQPALMSCGRAPLRHFAMLLLGRTHTSSNLRGQDFKKQPEPWKWKPLKLVRTQRLTLNML